MKPKRIGWDARMWEHPGIGRYIRELLPRIGAMTSDRLILFGPSKAQNSILSLVPSAEYRPTHSKIYSLGEQWEMGRVSNLDFLHTPHFNIPVFSPVRCVATIHDLTYLHHPGTSRSPLAQKYARFLLGRVAHRAIAIFTVSEYTKKDLLSAFSGLDERKVFVTYEAASETFKMNRNPHWLLPVKQKYSLQQPFVLYVGSVKRHKNLPTLVSALERVRRKRGLPHQLVIVGRLDKKEKALAKLLATHTAFVRHLGEGIDDDELCRLYNLADALVLPSFYEGFGLPVVEAMSCGTPVIASNRTSLPEVVGTAGRLFDPSSVDALEEVLYTVLDHPETRETMSKASLEQARRFSWQKTAERTLEVYARMALE